MVLKKRGFLRKNKKGSEKMEFEQVKQKSEFLHMEAGQEVVGVFIKKETSEMYPNQFNHILDIKDIGQKKISSLMLNNLFESVKEGTVVKLVYKGKKRGKRNQDYNEFELFQEKK